MENQVQLDDDLALPAGFGANSGSGAAFEYRKLAKADSELTERLLPQWGSLLQKGDIGVFSKLHYGWKVRNPSDPTKTVHRTFLCVEERNRGMVTRACPACELIKTYKNKLEELKKQEVDKLALVRAKAAEKGLNENQLNVGLSKVFEEFKALKQPVIDWLKDHNTDSKFRMHTINKAGTLGVLALPYGLSKDLKAEKAAVEKREYPASITKKRGVSVKANGMCGVFFKITRTGMASPKSDKVEVNRITNDDGSEVIDYHKITPEFLEHARQVLPDLVQMAEDSRLPPDKIQKLVDHCIACGGSCDPDTVEEIMGPRPTSKPVVADPVPAKAEIKPEPKAETKPEPTKTEVKAAEPAKEEPKAEPKVETKASQNMAEASDDEFDDLFK